jgi:hypothetical protein
MKIKSRQVAFADVPQWPVGGDRVYGAQSPGFQEGPEFHEAHQTWVLGRPWVDVMLRIYLELIA